MKIFSKAVVFISVPWKFSGISGDWWNESKSKYSSGEFCPLTASYSGSVFLFYLLMFFIIFYLGGKNTLMEFENSIIQHLIPIFTFAFILISLILWCTFFTFKNTWNWEAYLKLGYNQELVSLIGNVFFFYVTK